MFTKITKAKPKQQSSAPSKSRFDAQRLATAIHFYYTSRGQSTWEDVRNKFKVCTSTFNNYRQLWFTFNIADLPRSNQLSTLRNRIIEHHLIIRPGNFTLSSVEEKHILDWIITASERGRPFTGIQVRRLVIDAAAAARDDFNASKSQVDIAGLTKENFWIRFRPAWDFGIQEWRIVDGFARTGQWPVNENKPLEAIPALKSNESPVVAEARVAALRQFTLEDENRRLKAQLSASKREIKQLKSLLSVPTFSTPSSQPSSATEPAEITNIDHNASQVNLPSSYQQISELMNQYTPPRITKQRTADAAPPRSTKNDIHDTYLTDPNRLFSDEEAKLAHEHQRLARLGQAVEHQTIVRGDATAMGKAEADYLKSLIRELRDEREKLEAAKSAAKAKALDKARKKRAQVLAEKAAAEIANGVDGKRKRKRSKSDEDAVNDSSNAQLAGDSSKTSSTAPRNKKRKVDAVDPIPSHQTVIVDELIEPGVFDALATRVRQQLDHTPMTGAMRIRVNSIRRAQRLIDQWANWRVINVDDSLMKVKVRRINEEHRTPRAIRRPLVFQD